MDESTPAAELALSEASVFDVEAALARCTLLKEAATRDEGWRPVVTSPGITVYIKNGKGYELIFRAVIELDVPPAAAIEALANVGPECIEWRGDQFTEAWVVRENAPGDRVLAARLNMFRLLRRMLGYPDPMCLRVIVRHDTPSAGDVSYLCVPYDIDKGCEVEALGPLKVQSGIISAHPDDPRRSIARTLDLAGMGFLPDRMLGFIIKAVISKTVVGAVAKFSASNYYASHYAAEAKQYGTAAGG